MTHFSTSLYIGNTTRGIEQPVFYDSHTQIFNNRPPGTLITGAPGSGKTFLAMTLTCLSAILGKTTIVLDPKGDFLSFANLKDELGTVNFWNLANPNRKGLLDPFYMADTPGEQLALVVAVVEMFLGGITKDQMRVLSPIVKDVIESPIPSLLSVTEALTMSPDVEARNLGNELDLISKLPFASLCFAPGSKSRKNISISEGTTIITMVGLEISPDAAQSGQQNNKKRLASTIFFLVTNFIRRVLHESTSDTPKTLVIDEAWAVISTPAGASVIKEVALLGRSKSLALILVTQNASHLKNLDIENTIRTRFAFHTDTKEAKEIVESMELPKGEKFENVLTSLETGECLMQDWQERYSTIQIAAYNTRWKEAFETNPLKKRQQKKKTS